MRNKKYIIYFALLITLSTVIFLVKAQTNKINRKAPIGKVSKSNTAIKRSVKINNNTPYPADSYSTYMIDSQMSLAAGNGILTLDNITPTTALNTYGVPVSQTTEYSELDDATTTVFHYHAGTISFIGDHLCGIEALDEGFSFEFKTPDSGVTEYLGVGSEADPLYSDFPDSWENEELIDSPEGSKSVVSVYFTAADGTPLDACISFLLTGDINSNQSLTIHKIRVRY